MTTLQVGLLGFGTVGAGVARLLIDSADRIRDRLGMGLNLKYVADIDLTTDRGVRLAAGVLIDDAERVVNDPEVDIVIEMIGGEGIAKTLILQAIANGKQVVTANKALLAKHGKELFQAADRKGVDLAFEASVGGCMPVIKTLRESLVGNRINGMGGILNGTCNYILSRITDEGIDFREALAKATEAGYAEADPTLDVEGFDTAHKLAILTSLAYGTEVDFDDIFIEGITQITPLDIDFARQFGYRIKLLAISKNHGDRVEARVHPTMIPEGNLLSTISGSLNALNISGDAVGDVMLYGHGAGMMPTASAVVGDVVDIARNLSRGATGRVPLRSFQPDKIGRIPIVSVEELVTHYYFRFTVKDQPGVLSTISGILGEYGISIQSVQQKGRKSSGAVPVVMLTHRAREADVQKAFRRIEALDVVDEKPMLIRLEDNGGID
ncbi:MAG: homoserine dehydrogenase [Desulfobacteraceae bacterium]|nr:homoserine dehydrogenase [Desulfobacteraceae bacterium]MBC2748943.1 homoserine dehydrogenase [Desulfobacteraceae bacterium]